MSTHIHPTAIIDPSSELGAGLRIGPHAVIGAGVQIGDGTEVGAGAHVEGPTILGSGNRLYPHACIGFDPQDLKYGGEKTTLTVGDGNIFREFCTVHRGTVDGGGTTTIGSGNLFMTYTHVAHDCHVGDKTIFANAGTLAGHVVVEDGATVGAFSAVHQFCRVGRHAYIGGFSVITMDALPFMKTVGARPVCLGVNRIGLERKGFSGEAIKSIEGAMRLLLRSGLNTAEAIEAMTRDYPGVEEVGQIVDFASSSERGMIKGLPGKRGKGQGAMSTEQQSIRVGVVGTGVMGGHHVRILDSLPEADLVGFHDPDPVVAASVVERFGCRHFESVTELAENIEAAVIAAPTVAHRDLGCALLERGIHVLMEKPLAGSLAEADDLIEAAHEAVLAVGHVEFHNPAVKQILSLGLPPGFVEVHRMGVFSPRSLDIDVVLDLMIHDLQILHSLDPSPVETLHAVGVSVLSPRVDIANVRLELASGCVANLTASRVSAERIRKFRVFVHEGYYAVDYSEQEVRGYRLESRDGNREIVKADLPIDNQEPLRCELEGFLGACRGDENARVVTGEEGRRALETALQVVENLANRRGASGLLP